MHKIVSMSMSFSQIDEDDFSYEKHNQPRQRLRSWLTKQLDLGQCPGCQWLDYNKKIFKLTWKHYGRPGFDQENDAKMFREWAQHTRRWSPGDPPDVSTWKTRFRNALHKMPDIEEMHSLHELDGSEPYRVYRFRSPSELEKFKDTQKNGSADSNVFAANQKLTPNSSFANMSSLLPSTLVSTMPNTVSSFSNMISSTQNGHLSNNMVSTQTTLATQLYSSDQAVPIFKSLNADSACISSSCTNLSHYPIDSSPKIEAIKEFLTKPEHNWSEDVGMENETNEFDEDVRDLNSILQRMVGEPLEANDINAFNNNKTYFAIPKTAIAVSLYFSDQEVMTKIVNNINGVRIAYKAPPLVPIGIGREFEAGTVLSNIYGPLNAEQIYYPQGDDKNTQNLLGWIQRGLVIEVDSRGDIYGTRLCQAKVYFAASPLSQPKGLVRSQKTLLMSFQDDFLPQFKAYKSSQVDMAPSYELFFSFGQEWTRTAHIKEMLIHCSVTHLLSKKLFKDLKEQKLVDVQISTQDHLDMLKDDFEKFAVSDANTMKKNV